MLGQRGLPGLDPAVADALQETDAPVRWQRGHGEQRADHGPAGGQLHAVADDLPGLDDAPDAWTSRVLGGAERWEEGHEHVPLWGFVHYHRAPAKTTALERPRLAVIEDRESKGRRELRLRLWSPRMAPFVSLLLENEAGEVSAAVDGAAVAGGGTTFLDYSAEHWHVDVLNIPTGGVTVKLRLDAGVLLRFRVVDLSYGLPAVAYSVTGLRPDGFVPGGDGDATIVSAGYALGARTGGPLSSVFY